MAAGNSLNITSAGLVKFDGTATFSGVTVTQYDVLIGGASNSISSVGPGSAGQVLQSAGNASNPAYSTATFPSTATGTGTILRADGTNWTATTATYPNTATVSQILYASASNVISGLSTANNGMLVTSATGVPSILAGPGTTGNILQSNASAAPSFSTATYPSVATGTGTLLRADGTNWVATTSTYPNTNAVSTLLYASSANVMGALTTANNGLLVTSNTGVPSILAGPGTTGQVLQANAAAAPSFSTATFPSTATGTGKILRADGTNWVATTATFPDTAGTSGNVLTSDGTNWSSVSPALTLISFQNVANGSTAASVTFTSIGSFRNYLLVVCRCRPNTDADLLYLQMSTDNGANWLATNYTGGCTYASYNSTTLANSNATTAFVLSGPVNSGATTDYANASVYVLNANIANRPCITGTCQFTHNTGNTTTFGTVGGSTTNTGLNALQVLFSTGTIERGDFALYGLKGP